MPNVLSLASPVPIGAQDGPRLPVRVRLCSRALAVTLIGFAVLLACLAGGVMLAMLFYSGEAVRIGATGMWLGNGPGPPGYVAVCSLSLVHRLIYVGVGVVRTTPGVLVLINLAALFRLYDAGIVFDIANARRIRAVGFWLAVDAALPFLCHLLLSTSGYEIDKAWAHLASLQEMVIGAIVFVIAEVMKIGREIEEDRSQFV